MAVWIYTDTSKPVGDIEHLKVFATEEAATAWFAKNDPGGVAFEYEVIRLDAPSRPTMNHVGRRTLICMALILALVVVWQIVR
ncbi:hypothetical protein [Bradyrhizobium sp. S3.9.1]|uniref:hypothetical protein n=1 Tax=Bradyrhizobium sp. S3.9.1 TaxID=3156431 RepID=UPI003397178A